MLEVIVGVLGTGFLGWMAWMTKSQADQRADIAAVKAQHQNNGGKSMKDAIDRIDETVADLDRKLDAHLIDAASDKATMTAHIALCALTQAGRQL